jgi:hypothetical protein
MLCAALVLGLSASVADESMPSSITEVCQVETFVVAGAPAVGLMTDRDLTLVVELKLEKDWHTYWWDAGSWGAPPRLTINAPKGWQTGPIILPAPECFSTDLGEVYGYHHSVRFQVPMRRPDASPAELTYALDWLVCKEACLLGRASKTLNVPAILPNSGFPDLSQDAVYLAPERRLRSQLVGDALWVEHPESCLGQPKLVFRPLDAVSLPQAGPTKQNDGWVFPLDIRRQDFPSAGTVTLHGLLIFSDNGARETYAFSTTLNN